MGNLVIERAFERMGARVKITEPEMTRRMTRADLPGHLAIDIRSDRKGSYFAITAGDGIEMIPVDVKPDLRHIFLLARNVQTGQKDKFLCGHDERDWFVAAVPERSSASNIRTAMEALKPPEVLFAQNQAGLKAGQRSRRKNKAWIRQGEWFFIPLPKNLKVNTAVIHKHEPLQRGRGKPHWADELVRENGVTVYVCSRYPNGVSQDRYHQILASNPDARRWNWQARGIAAGVYVRGCIRHPDHKTITLHGWHRVEMNMEHQSRSMRNVQFLD